MENRREEIRQIISCVGGKDNISMLTHCVTRLRFVLKDETKIREKELKENPLVKGCFAAKSQYQVIIGPGVEKVYKEVQEETGAKEADSAELKKVETQKMNRLQRAVKIFADVFYPILPAIVGAGLLLGISNILTNPGIFGSQSVVEMVPAVAGLASMITMVANTGIYVYSGAGLLVGDETFWRKSHAGRISGTGAGKRRTDLRRFYVGGDLRGYPAGILECIWIKYHETGISELCAARTCSFLAPGFPGEKAEKGTA